MKLLERRKKFLLIDRRSAEYFRVLLIAYFSRSSSLEGISSAKTNQSKENRGEKSKKKKIFSENFELFELFSVLAKRVQK